MRGFLFIFIFLSACSSLEKKSTSAKESFDYANNLLESKQYDRAIKAFEDLKKFPNNEYTVKADLKIADINFRLKRFEEALYWYSRFRELYPTHKSSPYVLYQIANCYYNRVPKTSDRDLALATNSLQALNELIDSFPSYEHIEEAKGIKKSLVNLLAEKEFNIGNYYFERGHFKSALNRYLNVIKSYPETEVFALSLLGAGSSELKLKNNTEGKKYLDLLLKNFKDSKVALDANKLKKKHGL